MSDLESALEELATRDGSLAERSRALFAWLVGDQGLEVLTQASLQEFLWYSLTEKWSDDLGEQTRLAQALAQVFDRVGRARYAAICRGPATADVFAAYARSRTDGRKAFRRAVSASGIAAPDTDHLAWGTIMMATELRAWHSTAAFLETAIDSGDLVPGARGWKARQAELVVAHLNTARLELHGWTWIEGIREERIADWLRTRSQTRERLLVPLADLLREPPALDADDEDPVPPLRWLLESLVEPQPLTQAGYLPTAVVQDAVKRGFRSWHIHGNPRSEADLFPLQDTRQVAERARLVRKSSKKLGLTDRGRAALADPSEMVRAAATGLIPVEGFERSVCALTCAVMLGQERVDRAHFDSEVGTALAEEGWRVRGHEDEVDLTGIGWITHRTLNTCRSLGLLAADTSWRADGYALSDVGRVVAAYALHLMATGPRFAV